MCNSPTDGLIDLTQIDKPQPRVLRGATKKIAKPQHSVASSAPLHKCTSGVAATVLYVDISCNGSIGDGMHPVVEILYNWLIWRVLKLAFFSKKYFPCIYFGVWSSQNNAIFI